MTTQAASKCVTLLHLVAFPAYVYTLYYTIYVLDVPLPEPGYAYAGMWKFLTVWNLVLSMLYFGFCILLNVVPLKSLMRVRDYIFCSISLPTCVFVSCAFWGLYAYDPDLILPKKLEPFYPQWVNHSSHTSITVAAILEALLHRHKVPSVRDGLIGVGTWIGVYQAWIIYLGIVKGVWVYPIMKILPTVYCTIFFILNHIFLNLLYLGCNSALRWKNGSEDDADSKLKKVK